MRSQDFFAAVVAQVLNVNRLKVDELAHVNNDWRFLRDFGTVTLNLGARSGATTWIGKRLNEDVDACALLGSWKAKEGFGHYATNQACYHAFAVPDERMRVYSLVIVDQGSCQMTPSQITELQQFLGADGSKVRQLLILGG